MRRTNDWARTFVSKLYQSDRIGTIEWGGDEIGVDMGGAQGGGRGGESGGESGGWWVDIGRGSGAGQDAW